MGDLIAFLAARLAEDEAAASYAASLLPAYNPARALRGVEAARRILALHFRNPPGCCAECDDRDYPCPTLGCLAAVWSDHPDYRQEGKP